MYRHVLVPLDGSAAAERAIEPALALASSVRAAVELVHVHDPAWLPHDGVPTVDPRFDQDRARTMREALDAARTSIYTLLTVVQPLPPLDPFPDVTRWVNPEGVSSEQHATLADDLATARRQLDRTAGPLRHAGVSVDVVALVHPDPATAILEYAAGHAVDLIALATHGRSRLARAMVGSVARAVLHGSPVPVLACRPRSSRN